MLYSTILAGGSGTRLWPLSRASEPKFLHPLTGTDRTLLQATVDRTAELSEPDSAEDERILWGSPQADPETLLLRDLDHATVGRLMERLPASYREILLLREVEDLSYREIADITGTPVGTVMSRLSRAREALRRLWHGEAASETFSRENRNGA